MRAYALSYDLIMHAIDFIVEMFKDTVKSRTTLPGLSATLSEIRYVIEVKGLKTMVVMAHAFYLDAELWTNPVLFCS